MVFFKGGFEGDEGGEEQRVYRSAEDLRLIAAVLICSFVNNVSRDDPVRVAIAEF